LFFRDKQDLQQYGGQIGCHKREELLESEESENPQVKKTTTLAHSKLKLMLNTQPQQKTLIQFVVS
jgi:hypothetical protein